MQQFIKEREAAAKKQRFENLASATAHMQQLTIPKVDPSKKLNQVKQKPKPREVKKQQLTAKEKILLRKEEERKKQFEIMSSAAKTATQNFSE